MPSAGSWRTPSRWTIVFITSLMSVMVCGLYRLSIWFKHTLCSVGPRPNHARTITRDSSLSPNGSSGNTNLLSLRIIFRSSSRSLRILLILDHILVCKRSSSLPSHSCTSKCGLRWRSTTALFVTESRSRGRYVKKSCSSIKVRRAWDREVGQLAVLL